MKPLWLLLLLLFFPALGWTMPCHEAPTAQVTPQATAQAPAPVVLVDQADQLDLACRPCKHACCGVSVLPVAVSPVQGQFLPVRSVLMPVPLPLNAHIRALLRPPNAL